MGTGHIMRCLALARAWLAQGGSASILGHCPSAALCARISAAGIGFIPLEHPYPHPADAEQTLDQLRNLAGPGLSEPWLVVDGYHFDGTYHQQIRAAGFRLLVVDDLAGLPQYHADILLNQNLYARDLDYVCSSQTVRLLGSRYALLRPEFLSWRSWRRSIPPLARKLLVTLGGSDPDNVTLRVIQAVEQAGVPGLETVVAVGGTNPHCDSLHAAAAAATAAGGGPVRLVRDAANMPELMAWADVAVAAAGSTCWELAFMGLPSLALVLADNQQRNAAGLAAAGTADNLGWHAQVTTEQLARELSRLCQDQARREQMAQNGQRLVDGEGASRVVAVMAGLSQPSLTEGSLQLRLAGPDDAIELWHLANDPSVRQQSFNPEPIPLEHHLRWYAGKLNSPGTRIWVAELGGVIAGQVRYDQVSPETAEVGYYVSAPFRGKGIGTWLLAQTWAPACSELGVQIVRGVVLAENYPSCRAFEKAGFARMANQQIQGRTCEVFERTLRSKE